MSGTEQTSKQSQIPNFPIDVGVGGERHGDIRENVPWIGTDRICCFDCRNLGVGCRGLRDARPQCKARKLRSEAEDCEFIASLASDIRKRTLFARLALDLRSMARDVEAMIAARVTEAK
jgi:hypothetical protein